ncbi:FecR family protein [Halarcobacter sp.]|uniref:FecR family protein n=1 Tax=Halarcobacter sp. TaxID=2321133 RepID=UPI002AAB0326|nr:FecR family protein [Halarcobacter sp.]
MRKLILMLLLLTSSIFASIGNISKIEGTIEIKRGSSILNASLGQELEKKDLILTHENSMAVISLNDNTQLTVGKNSSLNIEDYYYDENDTTKSKAEFGFFKGAFKSVTGQIGKINPSKFKLKTKNATIGIRGTTVVADQETVIVLEGSVFVLSNNKQVIVDAGNFTKTLNKTEPSQAKEFTNKELDPILAKLYPNRKVITFTTENQNSKKSAKAQKGEVLINEDGSITYLIDKNFKGTDIITIFSNDSKNERIETIKVEIDEKGNIKLNLESVVLKDNQNFNILNPIDTKNIKEDIQNIENLATIPQNIPTNTPIPGINRFYLNSWQVPTQTNPFNYSPIGTGEIVSFNIPNNSVYLGTSNVDFSGSTYLSDVTIDSTNIQYGNPLDTTSYYYVNDDFFGTTGTFGGYTGWMQAVYDKYTSTGFTNSENNASWGYWQQDTAAAGMLSGVWVTGNPVSVSLFPTILTYDFSGQMMGYSKANSNTTLNNILMDTNNYITININIGSGITTGNYNFTTANNLTWSGSFSANHIATSGTTTFQANSIIANAGSQGIENVITTAIPNPLNGSYIKGQTYGNLLGVQSIGGSFNFYNSTNTAFGVFIADKQ